MTKITNDLNVKGLIRPGSFTAAQIASLNGSASNNGAIIYNDTDSRLEIGSGTTFVPVSSASTATEFKSQVFTSGTVLSQSLLPVENRIYRFKFQSQVGTSVFVEAGSTIFVYSYYTKIYEAKGSVYDHGQYQAEYDIERQDTNYFLREITPPKKSTYSYINNASTDVAVNYNTTTTTSLKMSTAQSALNFDNNNSRILVNTTTGIYTTQYTGFIEFHLNLNFTCAQNNNSIRVGIVNNTSGIASTWSVVKVIVANGTNVATLDKIGIAPCSFNDNFQISIVRYGTATSAMTLSNTAPFNTSRVTVRNYIP